MITTYELYRWAAKYMDCPDPATAPLTQREVMAVGINASLERLYSFLPRAYRQTPASTTIKAPSSVIIGVEKYSKTLTSGSFAEDERCCTVKIDGEEADNMIVSTSTLLCNILGDTRTAEATVYHDTIPIDEVIYEVVSNPKLHTGDVLCRVDALEMTRLSVDKKVGKPCRFTLMPAGVAGGSDTMAFIRLWPLPDIDYNVTLNIEVGPKRIMLSHLSNPIMLPVQSMLVQSVLLPLLEEEISRTPFYKGNAGMAATAAAKAIEHARNRVEGNMVRQKMQMRLPRYR